MSWLLMNISLARLLGKDCTPYFKDMQDLFILPLLVHLEIFSYLHLQIQQVCLLFVSCTCFLHWICKIWSHFAVRLWNTKFNANIVCYKGHNYPVWDVQVGVRVKLFNCVPSSLIVSLFIEDHENTCKFTLFI